MKISLVGAEYCCSKLQKELETIGDVTDVEILDIKDGKTLEDINYDNVVDSIISFFKLKIQELEKLGFSNIIIDPGFGFGKSIDDNYVILKNLKKLKSLERPIIAGLSRKSMIYKVLNNSPKEALNGTTVLNTLALDKGADIIRVHDVKEALECKKILEKLN